MDSSTVLTMLGLIAAVYAIIPKENKLDLSLRISVVDWIVISVSLIAIHYIMYYPILNELGLKYNFGVWKFGFNPNNTTYLIFLLLSIYLAVKFNIFRVNKSNISKFCDLLEQLLIKKKYDEVSHLIEKYFGDVATVSNSNKIRNKVSLFIKPKSEFDISLAVKKRNSNFVFDKCILKLSGIISVDEEYRENALAIISRIFSNKGFIKFLSESKPYYLLDLLKEQSFRGEVPFKLFISNLIDDKSSVFYYEIENTQNIGADNRYFLHPNNKLLFCLLKDCNVAKDMSVYKPVGDKINDLIDYDHMLIKKYNEPLGNYYENGLYECPVYCGLQFFNIMISESLHQHVKWHMWLYYYQSFTRKILNKLNIEDNVDLSKEWPTPFHFHLYTMVDNCLGWIYGLDFHSQQKIFKFNNTLPTHDNSSILKSSILCLGNLVYQIISNDKLSSDFKLYILEIVLRQLVNHKNADGYSLVNQALMKSIIYNGYANKLNCDYTIELYEMLDTVDHMITFELDEFKDLLETAIDS